tara:strand:- start:238 stop:492 length:255 start_codon:yes stop_codon:yes gene_type:complete
VVALLELLLSGVATQKGVVVLVYAVAKVLTSHADAGSLPALELAVVNKVPFLHTAAVWYSCTNPGLRLLATTSSDGGLKPLMQW